MQLRPLSLVVAIGLFVAACADTSGDDTSVPVDDTSTDDDLDGDGVAAPDDCDDADAGVFPGATELCNGVDDDCDNETDEDPPTWYADADADGYGDPGVAQAACDAPAGTVADATDCDDASASVYPGATDACDAV
ncbi:MAG: MopE-related protein, partial [Pseudomonadota bacterium]|nr:MopE-related protein [Pseudomonadota bacterium]